MIQDIKSAFKSIEKDKRKMMCYWKIIRLNRHKPQQTKIIKRSIFRG